ncbi:MAG: hypothetical protein PHX02_03355 [Oscillospiraceae bacterium]|nr:hypothetical protein [Oscillospiraceae bacterium]
MKIKVVMLLAVVFCVLLTGCKIASANTESYQQTKPHNAASANEYRDFNKNNLYAIYTVSNTDYNATKKAAYLYMSADKELKVKLGIISDALSDMFFENLPIEVVNIENKDGKKIAVINLLENEINRGQKDYSIHKRPSWALNFFQGSSGGGQTSTILVENFLQRQNKNQWVDGVRFLYNGNPITGFDHIPLLENTVYR